MQNTVFSYARFLLLASCFSLLALSNLHATNFEAGDEVRIGAPVQGDLYVAGGNVFIEAPVYGDLLAGGGEITVRDTIHEDAIVAGGQITFNGPVMDDLRVAGGEVTITRDIWGDLILFGGDVTVQSGVTIHGTLKLYGGDIDMGGSVIGPVNIGGGNIQFNGNAQNTLEIRAGNLDLNGEIFGEATLVAEDLDLGSDARFHKDVRYWQSGGEIEFGDRLLNGAQATFDESLKKDIKAERDFNIGKLLGFLTIYRILAAALIIAILIMLFSRYFKPVGTQLPSNWIAKLGYGLLYVLGGPILIIILMITVIGIPLGLICLFLYFLGLFLSHAFFSIFLAYTMRDYFNREWGRGMIWLSAVIVFIIIKVLGAVPFLGWLISIAITILALGAIILSFRKKDEIGAIETV